MNLEYFETSNILKRIQNIKGDDDEACVLVFSDNRGYSGGQLAYCRLLGRNGDGLCLPYRFSGGYHRWLF